MGIFFPAATPILPPGAIVDFFDFDGGSTTNKLLYENNSVGGSITVPTSTENGRFGIRQLNTLTGATNRAVISRGISQLILPADLWLWTTAIRINGGLSNSSQEYSLRIGLSDTVVGDFANGIYFEYDRATYGNANWRICVAVDSVREKQETTFAASIAWANFKAYGNDLSCVFKINDVTFGSMVNLPTAPMGRVIQLTKSVGTSTRTILIDYELFGYLAPEFI